MPLSTDQLIAILALLVAIVSPGATWLVAKGRNDHEAKQAAIARNQDRRETLYVDVLLYAGLVLDTVERIHPFMTYEGAPGPPEPPSEPERRLLYARLTAYGSVEIIRELQVLDALGSEFGVLAGTLEEEKVRDTSGTLAETRGALRAKREAVRDQMRVLGGLVNRELGGT